MTLNASRLTMYAVLSSIEEDLRILVQDYLNAQPLDQILDEAAFTRVRDRSKKEGFLKIEKIEDAIYFLDLGDLCPCVNRNKEHFPPEIVNQIQSYTSKISSLVPVRNRVAHGRPLDSSDFATVMEVAEQLILAEGSWLETKNCLRKLEQDATFVLQLKMPTREESDDLVSHNLPDPDYDETGFVGRSALVRTIRDLIRGPYPVISLIGVGGLGKTALALQVAYSLLEDSDLPFDAIVWVTAKSSSLSSIEIRRIDGAISDSLGLLKKAIKEIGGSSDSSSPVEELLELLGAFKIFLILDNLETVLDSNVKEFFSRLPSGSKVLTTSRIGIGAFDRPVTITPFDPQDSITLLRKMAKSRGVDSLLKLSNSRLSEYAKRMNNNPLHMKWFVIGIQSGRTADQIFSQPGPILEFCMQNVFEHLSPNARALLEVMQTMPQGSSFPELSYYCDLTPIEIRQCQNELIASNMISSTVVDRQHRSESMFTVNEFSRKYLQRFHPIPEKRQEELQDKRRSLVAEKERQSPFVLRTFDAFLIDTGSMGDAVVAKYLTNALRSCKKGDFEEAFANAEKAKEISPDFYEVYRVLAWIKNRSGDLIGANEDYTYSVELNPKSAKTLYFYAQFLMREFDDIPLAKKYFKLADAIVPNTPEISLELARCDLYTHDYDASDRVAEAIAFDEGRDERQRTIACDLLLQGKCRAAESVVSNHQPTQLLPKLNEFIEVFKKIPGPFLDDRMYDRVKRIQTSSSIAITMVGDLSWRSSVIERVGYLDKICAERRGLLHCAGRVKVIKPDRMFGFITRDNALEYYFKAYNLVIRSDWERLSEGVPVTFHIDASARKEGAELAEARNIMISSKS